ncbi:M23 family metallopeptidase [Paenibacillus sp. J22TS3]|uniref:M23 family metallopeptidase n=1 Tax=Paenibacillus sp. J22TS3 TaxID=2807192 RepID=UPI001B100B30|nr:M23 family metallopeptidase [Paenibacillus sp. J22TS3]GIP22408.1 hypothetical protein J22TS3_26830 [Paenibacillus sp. J22TS3]
MDMKSNVKKRREERIRQLLAAPADHVTSNKPLWDTAVPEFQDDKMNHRSEHIYREEPGPAEADPEQAWKMRSSRWLADSGEYPGGPYVPVSRSRASFWKMFMMRAFVSTLLFGALWGIHRYQPEWSLPIRVFVTKAMTEELDFKAAQVWYEQHFGGAPSFIPIFGQSEDKGQKVQGQRIFSAPVQGTVSSPFALSFKGIEIISTAPSGGSQLPVRSVETGRVTEVNQDVITGLTVQIQHADGYYSIYGHLGGAKVQKGDWIEGGEPIGTLKSSSEAEQVSLYFALKKDGQYIDPSAVVPFD